MATLLMQANAIARRYSRRGGPRLRTRFAVLAAGVVGAIWAEATEGRLTR